MPIRSISRANIRTPLAPPLGELSPKVTERVLHPGIPSPSSLRSSTSPIGRGKGCSHELLREAFSLSDVPVVGGEGFPVFADQFARRLAVLVFVADGVDHVFSAVVIA